MIAPERTTIAIGTAYTEGCKLLVGFVVSAAAAAAATVAVVVVAVIAAIVVGNVVKS